MKNTILPILSAALLAAAAGQASAQNLILNGSFEDTVIGNDTYLTVGNGGGSITNWTVGGSSVDMISGPSRWIAQDGNQAIDLAGTPGPGSVSQSVATTIGQQYTLTFFLCENHEGGGDKTVEVNYNGTMENLLGGVGNGNWIGFSRTFTASNAVTMVSFGSNAAGNFGGTVDNVSLQAVPEPATIASLALGAASMIRRRMRRS